MGVTKIDNLNTAQARVYIGASQPTAPSTYYGSATNDVDSAEWKGGELYYNTTINKLFVQQNTSGTTASWYRYQDVFTAV